jgi:hypothetical protein
MNSEGTNASIYTGEGTGSGDNTRPPITENPRQTDENLLDDLRETVEPFIRRKLREGKEPFRFVYAFGSANVTHFRRSANSDLGMLLRMIQEKQRTDDPTQMTYVYLFDTSYEEDRVRREVEEMNRHFGSPVRRQSLIWNATREGNIREENYSGGASASLQLRHEPFPTETFFPACYSFGPQCYLFFFNLNLQSSCAPTVIDDYEGQQQVKRLGFEGTALSCAPASRSAFAYLQTLTEELLVSGGELYLYNCAWEDTQVSIGNFYTRNLYFESLPEVLFLAFYDYSPKRIHRYILYNHFMNLFTNESIIVRSTVLNDNARHGHLRKVPVTPETEFYQTALARRRASSRQGGKRKQGRSLRKTRKVKRSRKH